MIRFMWKKRKIKRSLKKILFIYRREQIYEVVSVTSKILLILYYMIIHFTLPSRQQFFNFYNINENKSFNFSSGVLLKKAGHMVKFYKRSYNSMATIVLLFRQYYLGWWSSIYLLVIKNFNYRQIMLYKKLNTLMKLNIYYLIHNRPYRIHFFQQRRIKRRVLRLISSQ